MQTVSMPPLQPSDVPTMLSPASISTLNGTPTTPTRANAATDGVGVMTKSTFQASDLGNDGKLAASNGDIAKVAKSEEEIEKSALKPKVKKLKPKLTSSDDPDATKPKTKTSLKSKPPTTSTLETTSTKILSTEDISVRTTANTTPTASSALTTATSLRKTTKKLATKQDTLGETILSTATSDTSSSASTTIEPLKKPSTNLSTKLNKSLEATPTTTTPGTTSSATTTTDSLKKTTTKRKVKPTNSLETTPNTTTADETAILKETTSKTTLRKSTTKLATKRNTLVEATPSTNTTIIDTASTTTASEETSSTTTSTSTSTISLRKSTTKLAIQQNTSVETTPSANLADISSSESTSTFKKYTTKRTSKQNTSLEVSPNTTDATTSITENASSTFASTSTPTLRKYTAKLASKQDTSVDTVPSATTTDTSSSECTSAVSLRESTTKLTSKEKYSIEATPTTTSSTSTTTVSLRKSTTKLTTKQYTSLETPPSATTSDTNSSTSTIGAPSTKYITKLTTNSIASEETAPRKTAKTTTAATQSTNTKATLESPLTNGIDILTTKSKPNDVKGTSNLPLGKTDLSNGSQFSNTNQSPLKNTQHKTTTTSEVSHDISSVITATPNPRSTEINKEATPASSIKTLPKIFSTLKSKHETTASMTPTESSPTKTTNRKTEPASDITSSYTREISHVNGTHQASHKKELDSDTESIKSDDTFLERVRLAMRSSRPKTNGVPASAPQTHPKDSDEIIKGLKQALKETTNGPVAPKPPVPPQSQNRLRKQIRLLPKQRERSPQASATNGFSNGSAANYDSDDGLFSSKTVTEGPATTHASSIRTNTTTASTTTGTAQRNPSLSHVNLNGVSSTAKSYTSVSSISSVSTTSTLNGMRHSTSSSSFVGRSPSPALSIRSTTSSRSSYSTRSSITSNYSRLQTPPRRVFPQTYTRGDPLDVYEMRNLESSPVIFDGNMSFVLGCKKQPVHQTLRPSPSFEDPRTSSAYLSEKIQNFLRRTDHVQEEWSAMGRKTRRSTGGGSSVDSGRTTPTNSITYDDYDTISLIERQRERNSMERGASAGRSRSSQNIFTKAFQLSKTLPHTPTSRSMSQARSFSEDDDDRTIQEDDNEFDELSEMTVDLAEERSAANIATERLEAETAERLKLERELNDQHSKVKNLQETSEKLEMELICAKSDLNGISEDEDAENEGSGNANAVYKLKYERVARELEFTKRRLQTQHEHDLEQLVGLKKQLEKKLSDAYEEVEEQRQVVSQWKRKAQKMTNEMNDLRMLLEEQNGRNNLLEKKQRKFDSECQSLQDAARQERQAKDRLSREKDVLIAEKFTLEQTLADTRLELDLKEEKLASLQRELEEMTFGGGTEEEIAQLRRSKNELDRRVKEQEEELDEMAGQVQLLEQAKLRLEMTLETMRKEARREAQQRDDELEEARGNAYKKIKALECQLEAEHEERTLLLREKHELERRLSSMEDQDRVDRQAEEAATQKLKRDLRKYRALLKDAQAQLERLKSETTGKALIRQLRNQLEDAESARSLAMKSRQAAEAELSEVQAMFEEANRARNEAEDRANSAHRDRAELQAQIEENEEEMAELMKKYTASVKQLNTEQIAVSEYEFKLSEFEAERNNLKEQVTELQQRLENVENLADPSAAMMSKRLELRTKELESRLELEQATRARLDVQVNRHKEALEKIQNELAQCKGREMQSQDALKKSQKSLRDMREEFHVLAGRDQESVTKRKDLEKKVEQLESEAAALKNDLRLALQRIADLQQAMEEGDDDEEASDSDASQSSDVGGSLSDLEDRLKPIKVQRAALPVQNGESKSSTRTLVFEREDSSPRN